MKKLFSMMALGQALSVGGSYATSNSVAAATVEDQESQTKVATCTSGAKGMRGEGRKAYMRSCLSIEGKPPAQARITLCNAEAKGLKGDERKSFMSDCLK